MDSHRLSSSKQMTVNITKNHLLQVILAAQTFIQIAQSIDFSTRPTSDLNLLDPVVWDTDSLYKTRDEQQSHRSHTGRWKRSTLGSTGQQQLVDACESKMEVLTPYYATNSQGKLRTVINSELMQQAIQVETCSRSPKSQSVAKCSAQLDCGCEQKYKWHRLLVMDPSTSGLAKGLFMDWFLFPSNCVCRCKSSPSAVSKQTFLRLTKKTGE